MVSMNCRRARHLLFDFFDGASNETLRAEVERHLGECAECERFASEMTRSLALLRRVPVEPLDDTFNWKVRLAIHREKNAALERAASAGAWVHAWNVRYVLSTGFAFAAVLVVGGFMLLRGANVPVPVQLAKPAQQHDASAGGPTNVPRSTINLPADGDMMQNVSMGNTSGARGPAPVGAIDETKTAARVDSLINQDVMRLPEHERDRYLQRYIDRLRARQSQQPSLEH
jgi:hypothetical protein